ncbi:zinc carboxypeptidase A 1-like [Anopheles cruzii]|uniref:zinc carboxypeptidase A 1-like n=1 Tax=Anopheles cruzii TaxID=68878 RepID=UPI0022EC7B23|nr:zinc carboxypeptidase A 1-like [Anopheles cruzii]
MILKFVVLLICLGAGLLQAEPVRFDNYRVYEVSIGSEKQLEAFQYMERYPDGYIFWESPVQTNMKINLVVPPHKVAEFEELKQHLDFESRLKIANVQKLIDEESPQKSRRALGWDAYPSLEEINTWIGEKVAEYPTILSMTSIGQSYEGREMFAVKLSYKTGNPGIFIESNIHAREWITSATTEGGASSVPCTDTYGGPEPGSEIETKNIMNYFISVKDNIHAYFSFHSYGQYILFPYGHTGADYSENYYDMMEMGEASAIAIYGKYGTAYEVGTTADVLYIASGSSPDWAHGTHGTPVAATFEFRDNGYHGFILPPDQIIPNAMEVMDGLIAFLRKGKEIGYFTV